MFRNIFYGILALCSLAMLLFVVGYVFLHLGLSLLTGWFYWLAGKVMLLGFSAILLLGVLALIGAVRRELRGYFNREASALRQLLSVSIRRKESARRSEQQWQQLQYRGQFKRQRLLAADDRKQLRALFAAVSAELQAAKNQLPASSYQAMRKALRQYRKRADAEAILALREQLPCR